MSSTILYLTGSRYIGGAKPNSDWDFVVQHSEELQHELESCGFVRIAKQELAKEQADQPPKKDLDGIRLYWNALYQKATRQIGDANILARSD